MIEFFKNTFVAITIALTSFYSSVASLRPQPAHPSPTPNATIIATASASASASAKITPQPAKKTPRVQDIQEAKPQVTLLPQPTPTLQPLPTPTNAPTVTEQPPQKQLVSVPISNLNATFYCYQDKANLVSAMDFKVTAIKQAVQSCLNGAKMVGDVCVSLCSEDSCYKKCADKNTSDNNDCLSKYDVYKTLYELSDVIKQACP